MEKGNEDGLSISSVASCQNLWALIMDAGTGFTAQVYELAHVFLPKVRIPAQSDCNQEICSPKLSENCDMLGTMSVAVSLVCLVLYFRYLILSWPLSSMHETSGMTQVMLHLNQ